MEDREAVVDVASQAAARGKEHINSHQPGGEVKLLLCGHTEGVCGRVGTADQPHSLNSSVVFFHAGAVCVLVDLHRDEVRCDGNHQSIPDDSQDANGFQDLQPNSCRRGEGW